MSTEYVKLKLVANVKQDSIGGRQASLNNVPDPYPIGTVTK
jgi:hypothetical protein